MNEKKNYKSHVLINNELQEIKFSTADNPVEYLWTLYGMSTYIADLEVVQDETFKSNVIEGLAEVLHEVHEQTEKNEQTNIAIQSLNQQINEAFNETINGGE